MLNLLGSIQHVYSADEINPFSVANKNINLPTPSEFTLVTDEMLAIKQFNESDGDDLNELVASYISDNEVGTALSGVLPEMKRSFTVKVNKELQHEIFTASDFLELQQIIEEQNSNAYEQIEYEVTRTLDPDDPSSASLDLDDALKVSRILPLAIHHKGPSLFAHSMYINYGSSVPGGEDDVVAATLNYLNLNGTVLFVYAFAPQDELEWTQTSSLVWSNKILAANQHSATVFSRPVFFSIVLILLAIIIWFVLKKKKI